MLKLIEYIATHNGWAASLQDPPYCLSIKFDKGLTIFSYTSQSDFNEKICREARGIIIDVTYLRVVSYAFDKFFNWGDRNSSQIDWGSASVQTKLDGSLIKIVRDDKFHNVKDWNILISTNNCIDAFTADLPDPSVFKTFGDLVRSELEKYASRIESGYTYIFEICSPYNRVIIPYRETKLWHIGTRNNLTLQEEDIELGIEKPETHSLHSIDDCVKTAARLPYTEEGYVVTDRAYNRVKVKSPSYVAAHQIICNLSEKRVFRLITTGEVDRFMEEFPEHKMLVDRVKTWIRNFEEYVKWFTETNNLLDIVSDKVFAKAVVGCKCSNFMFGRRHGKWKTPMEFLEQYPDSKVIDFLTCFRSTHG